MTHLLFRPGVWVAGSLKGWNQLDSQVVEAGRGGVKSAPETVGEGERGGGPADRLAGHHPHAPSSSPALTWTWTLLPLKPILFFQASCPRDGI